MILLDLTIIKVEYRLIILLCWWEQIPSEVEEEWGSHLEHFPTLLWFARPLPSLWGLSESALSWPYMWQLFSPLQVQPDVWRRYFMMRP